MPRPRIVAPVAAPLLVLAVLGGACKEPEATPEPKGPEVVSVMVDVPDASVEQLNDAAEVVRARVMALDLQVGEIGWDDASIEVVVPAADEELVRAALAPAGVIEFRPVLQTVTDGSQPLPLSEESPDGQAVAATPDGVVYLLGPAAVDSSGVESATATRRASGGWAVNPTLVEDPTARGVQRARGECFAASPTCPAADEGKGLVATCSTTWCSPPVDQRAGFERDQIQISGEFDRPCAGAGCGVDGGATATAWTVRD
jgi:hypothetical protein